ncbi:MAG: dihydroorotate dehydrogenase [Actinobacteria bacterium]|nr:dihydroorotate dehydrogenase [Actinomycetota bacterium]
MHSLETSLASVSLRTPIIGACGTVGSVVEMAGVADLGMYGAMVAKSVSLEPWPGRPAPRMAPVGTGMLNGIGIQNPGVAAWADTVGPQISGLNVPVWGSAVGGSPAEFAAVASGLVSAGVGAIELNLSCPNLEHGSIFALDPVASAAVVAAARSAVSAPLGAKLSPDSENICAVVDAVMTAGADWVVLGNAVRGFGIDIATRRPLITGGIGGYSGSPIKPIALRSVFEAAQAFPEVPIVGCGGVSTAEDVIEFMLAGASAVAVGTAHFARPRIAATLVKGIARYLKKHRLESVSELIGGVQLWP